MKKISQLCNCKKELGNNVFSVGRNPLRESPEFKKVNVLALGDVGINLILGLKLLGGNIISNIGIKDLNPNREFRIEMEMNQIAFPDERPVPEVNILKDEDIFDCDVFAFCASMNVPAADERIEDPRLVQFESNRKLISYYGKKAIEKKFGGLFAVVSDPVDQLAYELVKIGLSPWHIKGFGLGVMRSRALYFAEKTHIVKNVKSKIRAYGPHGQGLIIANAVGSEYDEKISQKLTKLTLESNITTRKLGYKPFIAPAISSGAISVLETIKGNWNYSSVYFGECFFGCLNRFEKEYIEVENPDINSVLFKRLEICLKGLENGR